MCQQKQACGAASIRAMYRRRIPTVLECVAASTKLPLINRTPPTWVRTSIYFNLATSFRISTAVKCACVYLHQGFIRFAHNSRSFQNMTGMRGSFDQSNLPSNSQQQQPNLRGSFDQSSMQQNQQHWQQQQPNLRASFDQSNLQQQQPAQNNLRSSFDQAVSTTQQIHKTIIHLN